MTTIYVDSGAGVLVYVNRVWSVGDKMVPSTSTASDHGKSAVWECTVGGTSTAAPTWPSTAVTYDVTTITQNGVEWIARAPTSWEYAYPGLYWAVSNDNVRMAVAGDYIKLASTHSCSYGGVITYRFPLDGDAGVRVQSVNKTTGVLEFGATEIGGTNITLAFVGQAHMYGMDFRSGSGNSNNQGFTMSNSNECGFLFENCSFWLNNTGATSTITLGTVHDEGNVTRLLNCKYRFGVAGHSFALGGNVEMRNVVPDPNCATVDKTFTEPVSPGKLHASSCDFSKGTNLFSASTGRGFAFNFANCLFTDSFSLTLPTNRAKGFTLEAFSCGTGDNITGYTFLNQAGLVRESVTVYRSGGAQTREQDGELVGYSLQLVGGPGQDSYEPLYTPWISIYNPSVGSVVVTLNAAYDSDTQDLSTSETWLEVEHYKDSTTPLSQMDTTAPVVAGTTSRDTEITDAPQIALVGTTWNDPGALGLQKIALSKTVNVQQAGFIRVRVGHASPLPLYVDPKILLS